MALNPNQLKSGGVQWVTKFFDGEDCERLLYYTGDGLCPVLLGDVLSGEDLFNKGQHCSFKMINKLGSGGFATVWLVQDTASSKHKPRYLALKVLRHDVSTLDNGEMRILGKLGKLQAAFFYIHQTTRRHFLCLGMQLVGCTLSNRYNSMIDSPNDAKSIQAFMKALIDKVLAFHRKGIHHGDLSTSNFCLGLHKDALKSDSLTKAFEQNMKNHVLAEPEMVNLPPRPPYLPEYLVTSHEGLLSDGQNMSLIEIIDFGTASDLSSSKNPIFTAYYNANLVARDHEGIRNTKTDIWSLGCIVVFGLTDDHFFRYTENREKYLKGNSSTQVSLIGQHLYNNNEFLYYNNDMREDVARIIHSLLQLEPEDRDLERTRHFLKRLDKYVS